MFPPPKVAHPQRTPCGLGNHAAARAPGVRERSHANEGGEKRQVGKAHRSRQRRTSTFPGTIGASSGWPARRRMHSRITSPSSAARKSRMIRSWRRGGSHTSDGNAVARKAKAGGQRDAQEADRAAYNASPESTSVLEVAENGHAAADSDRNSESHAPRELPSKAAVCRRLAPEQMLRTHRHFTRKSHPKGNYGRFLE